MYKGLRKVLIIAPSNVSTIWGIASYCFCSIYSTNHHSALLKVALIIRTYMQYHTGSLLAAVKQPNRVWIPQLYLLHLKPCTTISIMLQPIPRMVCPATTSLIRAVLVRLELTIVFSSNIKHRSNFSAIYYRRQFSTF